MKGQIQSIKKGEVVLIHDEIPRVNWKLGIITEVFSGIDGIVRSVKLRSKSGYVTRPVTKCFPLELSVENYDVENCKNIDKRPLRVAAMKARKANP